MRASRFFELLTYFVLGWLVSAFICEVAKAQNNRYFTDNFIVTGPFAEQIAKRAEQCRHDLAVRFFDAPFPDWANKADIVIVTNGGGDYGAGSTSFALDNGEVFGFSGKWQGSYQQLIDSVVPHEVCHTVLATYYRKTLPRWFDEGFASTVEASPQRQALQNRLVWYLRTNKGIPFAQMLSEMNYSNNIDYTMGLYCQGYSLCKYLIALKGEKTLLNAAQRAYESTWLIAFQESYGINSIQELQDNWLEWVRLGSPNRIANQQCGPNDPYCSSPYYYPSNKVYPSQTYKSTTTRPAITPSTSAPVPDYQAPPAPTTKTSTAHPGYRAETVYVPIGDKTPSVVTPGPVVSENPPLVPVNPRVATTQICICATCNCSKCSCGHTKGCDCCQCESGKPTPKPDDSTGISKPTGINFPVITSAPASKVDYQKLASEVVKRLPPINVRYEGGDNTLTPVKLGETLSIPPIKMEIKEGDSISRHTGQLGKPIAIGLGSTVTKLPVTP